VPEDAHRRLADSAEEDQPGREDLPHLRPILNGACDRNNPELLRAIAEEGIELWVTKLART
jgi:hypothetical protein